ncbi:MAG: DUF4956 domain-containing protein [Bacteroidales bacterium]|nr:DUF4956 domain-containing protein [Bacteroidales bacterium]
MAIILAFLDLITDLASSTEVLDETSKFLGTKLIDTKDFLELLFRFCFHMIISITLVRYLYYPVARRKDYLFTYIMISVTIFFLCFLLENVKLQLGFALGLFAIFGIIRYRTNQIPIKEMTYLFVVIGIAVINALANKKISYTELIFTNLAILAVVFIVERMWLLKHESSKVIVYEKIELVKPQRYLDLMADLEERTGLKLRRAEVGKIDFLQDTASIKIFYYSSENINISGMENFSDFSNHENN